MSKPIRRAALVAEPVARLIGEAGARAKGTGRSGAVDLTMPRGSFHFITGPSGAGKSRLLQTLALARRPARGAVELFGGDPWLLAEHERSALRRRIGFNGGQEGLIDRLTTFQNAALPLVLAGEAAADRRADVAEMLGWLGLAEVADAPVQTLDRARRRAVAVARALLPRPELILIDDPFDDLTPEVAERVLGLLAALGQGEAAVVLAGRDPARAKQAGATVVTLGGVRP